MSAQQSSTGEIPKNHNVHQPGNVFEKIIKGESQAKKVYEDENVIAINDIAPKAPVHILVIPKKAYYSFDDLVEKGSAEEVATFFKTVRKVANQAGLQEAGYRIVMNSGFHSEQVVPHAHCHILGGRLLGEITTVPEHQADHGRHSKAAATAAGAH